MNQNQPNNTLGIIGLVLGIVALLFSFIPCLGTLAFIPGIVGLILGVLAFLKAKDNGHPKGIAIGGIVVSALACIVSFFLIFTLGTMFSDIKSEMKEYTDCTEIEKDYKAIQEDMAAITKEMENDNTSFSNIGKMAKLGANLGNLQSQAEKLNCDINFDDFDPTMESEGEAEGNEEDGVEEGEESNEEESNEEEGN